MTRAQMLTRYVQLAQQPGWWAYVQQRVRELDADTSGLFAGIGAEWRAQLAALGFKPDPCELGEWWIVKSEAERPRRRA